MVQPHAQQLLNQKESENDSSRRTMPTEAGQRMFAATERLISALGKLERSMQHLGSSQQHDEAQQELLLFTHENEALRHERGNLNAAIEQLQQQYSDLHRVASTIYGKLDDSIKRLTQIIEH